MEPTINRIVRYVSETGQVLPAIITAVHSNDLVNLQVFTDGPNSIGMLSPTDFPNGQMPNGYIGTVPPVVWRGSVSRDDGKTMTRSWHFPDLT